MSSRGSLVVLTSIGVLLGAPAAVADQQIGATAGNQYTNANPTIDQGEPLTFRNGDPIAKHDVTSNDKGGVDGYLFRSDTIGNGETSFVEGSQYLTTGTYSYYCTIHPEQMKGTITVTANGTPKPRPGTGDPGGGGTTTSQPDTAAPVLELNGVAAKASSLKKGRALRLTAGSNEAATLVVTVKLKSTRLARQKFELGSAGTRKVEVRVAKKLRSKLRKGSKLAVTLDATDPAGNAAHADIALKLK